MADNERRPIRWEKKGGYPGGRPAEPVPPPPKTPSGSSVGAAARERTK